MIPNGQVFTHGNLSVIWRHGEEPKLDESVVKQVYDGIFVPALRADILRLYSIYVASHQAPKSIGFGDYLGALADTKEALGMMALPDLGSVETRLERAHTEFSERKVFEIRRASRYIVRDHEKSSIAPDDSGFMAARYNCIGYDTSAALRTIAAHMASEKGMAELYIATVQGEKAVKKLLTEHWVHTRRAEDFAAIRKRLFECTAALKMAEHVDFARRADKSEPRVDDIDEARRIANLRVVAGTQGPSKNRAA